MIASFTGPTRLLKSLEAVRVAHPYGETSPLTMGGRVEADAAALWNRLLGLPAEQLDQAIKRLAKLEVRLLIASAPARIREPGVLAVLSALYARTADKGLAALLWESFLMNPEAPELRRSVQSLVTLPGTPSFWKALAGATVPSQLAARTFLQQSMPFDDWSKRSDVALARFKRFCRLVQAHLIEPPMLARTDRVVAHQVVDTWASTAIEAQERVRWQQRYLVETHGHPRPLDHSVLSRVVDQHDVPDAQRSFWATLPDHVRLDVGEWLKDRQLTQLLGEGERVEFWRRFLPLMIDSIASDDGLVVFVMFEKWFAAQFVNAGTATYLFPRTLLWSLRKNGDDEYNIRRRVLRFQEKQLGRYEHRGYSWETYAESEVRLAMIRAESL
jgi:hypothetical protein